LSIHVYTFEDLPLLAISPQVRDGKNYFEILLPKEFVNQNVSFLVDNSLVRVSADNNAVVVFKNKSTIKMFQKK
jgi:hypothetical protein